MAARPVTIRVKQLKELQKAMKAGESTLDPSQVTPVLYRALQIFYDEARKNLLSVARVRTGNLLKSLTLTAGKSTTVARAYVRDKARHAHLIEYGHDIWHGGRKKKGVGVSMGSVKARPYFRPALDSTRASVRKAIRVGLQELLAKALPGKPGNASD